MKSLDHVFDEANEFAACLSPEHRALFERILTGRYRPALHVLTYSNAKEEGRADAFLSWFKYLSKGRLPAKRKRQN